MDPGEGGMALRGEPGDGDWTLARGEGIRCIASHRPWQLGGHDAYVAFFLVVAGLARRSGLAEYRGSHFASSSLIRSNGLYRIVRRCSSSCRDLVFILSTYTRFGPTFPAGREESPCKTVVIPELD